MRITTAARRKVAYEKCMSAGVMLQHSRHELGRTIRVEYRGLTEAEVKYLQQITQELNETGEKLLKLQRRLFNSIQHTGLYGPR
jgi:5-bromo-4-chloroindolyl phosphate hydrolysis protein